MSQKTPAAFMSYVHADDKYGHLTTLRERLSDEVQVQTGIEFPIFQDRKDIQWGQNWRQRIENSLDEITFLIPIITPSFFNSKACRDELKRFAEREKKLGRNDLILPIYFVDTPLLNDAELCASDDLAELIASHQYADWRELRFEPFTNPQVGKTLAKLAVQIRDALPGDQPTKKAPGKTSPVTAQPTAVTTGESGEQPSENPTAKTELPTCIVDPFHRGDFATISEAIKKVKPGTRILVRPGLYQEGVVIDKPLEIIGHGEPGEVVIQTAGISGILFQTTMGRVVNLTLRQMAGGECFGVDIAQGRLELEDCDITSQSLSCIAIHGGADPRLRRNRIHDGKQSAVYVYDGGQGTLEDNDIFNTALAGVAIKTSGNPTLRRNRIHDGKESGVYMYDGGQGTLEDNDIFGNGLSGVAIKDGADPTLRRNRIYDSKENGVFVYDGAHGTLEDNDIFGNGFSGVEIKNTGNPMLRRNRIHDNKKASGVYVHDAGQGTIEDNDIFSNAFWGITSISGSNPVVRNNRIYKNGYNGVRVYESGGGTFENNDLSENAKGAWSIAEDSEANVTRINNKEDL